MIFNKIINLLDFSRLCFYLFFALLPFSIGTVFASSDINYFGFFNPYSSYIFYFSELLLLLTIFFFLIYLFFDKEKLKLHLKANRIAGLFILFVVTVFISLLFSVDFGNSLLYVWRFWELLIIFLLFSTGLFSFKRVMQCFVVVMLFQAVLAILQFAMQESVGLYFLGEPVLTMGIKGLATIQISGDKILRPYGTFSHPNILGMYLLFAFYFVIFLSNNFKIKFLFHLLLLVFFVALVLTFSRTVLLAFFLSTFVYLFSTKGKTNMKYFVVSLILVLFGIYFFGISEIFSQRFKFNLDVAMVERLRLMKIALKMFLDNPFGVGAGNFTLVMQQYSSLKLLPWNFQPVHNIFLLAFAELGFLGGLVLVALFFESFRKYFQILAIPVLLAALLDHYFLSLFQGQVLFVLFISMMAYPSKSFR